MSDEAAGTARAGEFYPQRANRAFEDQMALRNAQADAAFFLPYLQPGMRLLDVGCGPGSITLGLAGAVSPGEVIGVDLQQAQVERAAAAAANGGVTNVRFEVADLYDLPFPDGSFDAAMAHAVLMHVREPARALREVRRVLRPGGVIGVRDPDAGGRLLFPLPPLYQQWAPIADRVRALNGSTIYRGRQHRALLHECGFARVVAGATIQSDGALDETRRRAQFFLAQDRGLAVTAIAQGWVTPEFMDRLAEDMNAWAEDPGAFFTSTWCHAIGWVDGAAPG